ncbi:MAG: hypothetical protein O3B73_14795, partial [bacterium]|nr:hypothetical protein [bacterium]
MLWFQVLFIFFVFVSSAVAEEVPAEILRRAEDAYRGGDFAGAFSVLSEIPGLLGVVPLLDQPKARVRAEIFFDLARIQIARKDTFRAKSILTHVFALDKDAAHGILDLSSDKALSQTRDGLA